MSHPTRTRTRNRLYLIGVLPAVLMLLVSGRVTLLLVEESSGLSAYDAEQYGDARDDFAANQVLNPFEPWLAHFDEGTARHRDGDLDGAVAAYEEALDEGVPPEWDCPVRNNLALAHEGLGDALLETRGRVAAEDEWLLGRQVLAECLDPQNPADTDGDGEVSLEDADTDGDGTLSPEEYAAATEGEKVVSAEEADANGDGTISAEEYAAAVPAAEPPTPEESDTEADANGDGTVSSEEHSVVIDRRLADKLEDRDPATPPDPTDPPPSDESVAERQRQLSERDRKALEQRRRQEQRRQEREDSKPPEEPEPGDVRIPHW